MNHVWAHAVTRSSQLNTSDICAPTHFCHLLCWLSGLNCSVFMYFHPCLWGSGHMWHWKLFQLWLQNICLLIKEPAYLRSSQDSYNRTSGSCVISLNHNIMKGRVTVCLDGSLCTLRKQPYSSQQHGHTNPVTLYSNSLWFHSIWCFCVGS